MSNGRTRGGSPQIPDDLSELKPDKLVTIADHLGSEFVNAKIGTSQIRNVFSEIKRIQQGWKKDKSFDQLKRDLILLKPKLAYASGRKVNIGPFKNALEDAVDAVINSTKQEDAVDNFFELTEAMVAYHKYYEEEAKGR